MADMDLWIQRDMSGGENSLQPPDSLADNQVALMKNILPRVTDDGYHVRHGFSELLDLGYPVHKMFAKRYIDDTSALVSVLDKGSSIDVNVTGTLTARVDNKSMVELSPVYQVPSSIEPIEQTSGTAKLFPVGPGDTTSVWKTFTIDAARVVKSLSLKTSGFGYVVPSIYATTEGTPDGDTGLIGDFESFVADGFGVTTSVPATSGIGIPLSAGTYSIVAYTENSSLSFFRTTDGTASAGITGYLDANTGWTEGDGTDADVELWFSLQFEDYGEWAGSSFTDTGIYSGSGHNLTNDTQFYAKFSAAIPDYDCRININTSKLGYSTLGTFHLYYSLNGATEVDVGAFDIGSPCYVDFLAADTGTCVFYAEVGGGAGDGGTFDGITIVETASDSVIHSYSAGAPKTVYFCDWDGDRILFSNGDASGTGLYYWDKSNLSATKCVDTDNANTDAPSGKYLTQHKGRLFMAGYCDNNSFSRLHMSGSDDSVGAGRFESWSGTTASSGGSIDIVPYGTDIVGLASSYGGVLVFKETSIHLFSYNDGESAPWNAESGGQVDVLYSGIGCLSHESIVTNDDKTIFMGKTSAGEVGLYVLSNNELQKLSTTIPETMKKVVGKGDGVIFGEVYDNFYFLLATEFGKPKSVMAVCDLTTGAWATIDTMPMYCSHRPMGEDRLLFGTMEHNVLYYPSERFTDINANIPVEVKTKRICGGSLSDDLYFRLVRLYGGAEKPTNVTCTLVGERSDSQQLTDVTLSASGDEPWYQFLDPSAGYYNSGEDVWLADPSADLWEDSYFEDEVQTEADFRSRGAQLKIEASVSSDFTIDYLSVGTRPRRIRSYQNA